MFSPVISIPVYAVQTDTHACTVHDLLSFTHAWPSKPKPVSPTLGSTLSRQASMPCQRQHPISRAPPSSHGSTPQTDDSYTIGYDPAGTCTHNHKVFSFHIHVLQGFTFPHPNSTLSQVSP